MLLDIHLPDMSGLEVLQRLRARPGGQDLDVIAITAAREVDTVRAAMAGGVAHYLIKPFTLQVFRERLEGYAAQRRELRRRAARKGTVRDQSEVDRLLSAPTAGCLRRRPAEGPVATHSLDRGRGPARAPRATCRPARRPLGAACPG